MGGIITEATVLCGIYAAFVIDQEIELIKKAKENPAQAWDDFFEHPNSDEEEDLFLSSDSDDD